MEKENLKYISLQEATKDCSYSQEYLSLLARQGKLKAVKIGRNWVTTKEWLEEYLDRVNNFNNNNKKNKKLVSQTSAEPFGGEPLRAVEPLSRTPLAEDQKEVPPPVNLPFEAPTKEETVHSEPKIERERLPFEFRPPKIEFGEKARSAVLVAVAFVLLVTGGVFGKEILKSVFQESNLYVKTLNQEVDENIVRGWKGMRDGVQKVGQATDEGIIKGWTGINNGIQGITWAGDFVFEGVATSFKESFAQVSGDISQFSDGLSRFSGDTISTIGKIVYLGLAGINQLADVSKEVPVLIFEPIQETGQTIGQGLEGIGRGITRAWGTVSQAGDFVIGGIAKSFDESFTQVSGDISQFSKGASSTIKKIGSFGLGGTNKLVNVFQEIPKLILESTKETGQTIGQGLEVIGGGVIEGTERISKISSVLTTALSQGLGSGVQGITEAVKETGQRVESLVSGFGDRISDLNKFVSQLFKRETVVKTEKEVIPEEIEKEIFKLADEIQRLKIEGLPVKEILQEVVQITKIEPVKEITREIIRVDESALAEVTTSLTVLGTKISSLENRTSRGLYIPSPVYVPPVSFSVSGNITEGGTALSSKYISIPSSSAQGDVLYRDDSAWTRLAAGTSGQYLQTQGSSANPAWASAPSGLFTDGGAITYLTATADDLALGGTDSTAPFFMDVSTGNLTLTGDLTVTGGDITGANSEAIDIGEAADGSITFSESGGQSITFDIDATNPAISASTGTLAISSILDMNGADGSDFAGSITFNDDVDMTFAGTENLAITSDLAGTVNVLSIIGTPSASSGTVYGIVIDQADSANSNGIDASLVIDNSDITGLAIADGILFVDAGSGFTDFIDTPSSVFKVDGSGNVTLVDLIISGGNINPSADLTIGDGGDTLALSLKDASTDSLDIQQGADNYININTTDSSEAMQFGNATTNPSFSFLGSGAVSIAGDLTVTGGDITGANSEAIDIGEADDGSITFTSSGGSNNEDLELDLETTTYPTLLTSTATKIGIDEDLEFVGAQTISTSTGNLTIDSGGTLVISDVIDMNGADGTDFAGSITFNDDVDFALTDTENFTIDNTDMNDIEANLTLVSFRYSVYDNPATPNIQHVLELIAEEDNDFQSWDDANDSVLDVIFRGDEGNQGDNVANLTAGIRIIAETQDTNSPVTIADGILFSTTGDGTEIITDAIDASDSQIANALNLGANTILASGSFDIDVQNDGSDSTLKLFNSLSDATADEVVKLELHSEANVNDKNMLSVVTDFTADETEQFYVDSDGTMAANLLVDLNGLTTSQTTAICYLTLGGADIFYDCDGGAGDYAEYYATTAGIEPGDVVSLDFQEPLLVVKSSQSYDQKVFGIISTFPQDPIGDNIPEEDNPQPVALTGRVPVKISLENGPIRIGDKLTSSSIPGVAMKATETGSVIGTALENYDGLIQISQGVQNVHNLFANAEEDVRQAGRDFGYSEEEIEAEVERKKLEGFLKSPPPIPPEGIGKIIVFISVSYYISAEDIAQMNADIEAVSGGLTDSLMSGISDIAGFFKEGLAGLGLFVENGVAQIQKLIAGVIETENLKVGSSEKPTGITIFDEDTGQPYCIKMKNGQILSVAGECSSGMTNNQTPESPAQFIEEPPVEEPVTEPEPVLEPTSEPPAEEPTPEELTPSEPPPEEPLTEPLVEQPPPEEPATEEPIVEEPPPTEEPVSEQSVEQPTEEPTS